MRNPYSKRIFAWVVMLSVSSLAVAQRGEPPRQTPNEKPNATTARFNPRDLSGVWQRTNRLLTLSDAVPPLTSQGQAKFNANKPGYGPRAVPPAQGNDPMGKCDPLGVPRVLLLETADFVDNRAGNPMEIIQTSDRIIQHFEWHNYWREIWTDGRQLPKDPDPRWMGYSVGMWEGNTFVVESIGFDDRNWVDHFGNPISAGMRLEERYRRLDRDNLELVITITDPETYTSPWVSEKKIFKLNPKTQIQEIFCVPSEEEAFNKVRDLAGGKGESKQ